jgi:hypothetical protein
VCHWFSLILSPAHIRSHQQLVPPSICSSPVRHLSFSSRSPEQDRCAPPGLGPGLFFFLLLTSVYVSLVLRFRRYLSLLSIISPCSSAVERTQCCVLPRPSVLARRFASHGSNPRTDRLSIARWFWPSQKRGSSGLIWDIGQVPVMNFDWLSFNPLLLPSPVLQLVSESI